MFQEIARLFGDSRRAKLLKFFVFQQNAHFTARAAGAAVGIPSALAERECRALARFGILSCRARRGGVQYAANPKHALLEPVRVFLDATTLPDDRAIVAAFSGVSGVSLIVASGNVVREERSPIDLLVVARKSRHPGVLRAVARLERRAGLPLRYAVMEPRAYAERLEGNDRLLRDVFEFQHRVVLGRP